MNHANPCGRCPGIMMMFVLGTKNYKYSFWTYDWCIICLICIYIYIYIICFDLVFCVGLIFRVDIMVFLSFVRGGRGGPLPTPPTTTTHHHHPQQPTNTHQHRTPPNPTEPHLPPATNHQPPPTTQLCAGAVARALCGSYSSGSSSPLVKIRFQ